MATFYRAFRYKLAPTAEQAAKFEQFAGVVRFVYNLALEQRERMWTYYRDNGTPLNYFQQSAELTQLRAEVDWIEAVPRDAQQAALKDLDTAYANFFAGRARYPAWRIKGVNESFRLRAREVPTKKISDRWSAARLPKIGWVRYRDTRPLRGTVKTVTVSGGPLGWHISFASEVDVAVEPTGLPAVGIDRGVANTLALSTGEMLSVPASLAAMNKRIARAQRITARRVKGSSRYRAARSRVASLRAKQARIRADWQHNATSDIARHFGTVVIEDLRVTHMTAKGAGKRGLNRSILAQGWGAIARMLDYKLAERGGTLVSVDPAHTSQTCSACGTIDKLSRESQARFVCRHCGFETHADTNAALNILRRNTPAQDVEGSRSRPIEASTIMVAA